nr:hypothetical protein [Neisseria meningitidis]
MPSEACLVFRRHFLRLKQRIGNPAPPAQAARAATSGSKDRALYFIAYSILMMC